MKRLGLRVKHPSTPLLSLPPGLRPPFRVWGDVREQAWRQQQSLSASREEALSVATFNLWNVNPHAEARMEALCQWLSRLRPHVVLLQEVRRLGGPSGVLQIDYVQQLLNAQHGLVYESLYVRTHEEKEGSEEGHGVLYMTEKAERLRWAELELRPLPQYRGMGPIRKVVHLRLRLSSASPPVLLDLFSVHLSIFDRDQCSQVAQLAHFLALHAPSPPADSADRHAVVVAGDFNAYFDFEHPMDFLGPDGPLLPARLDPCRDHYAALVPPAPPPRLRDAMHDQWGYQLHLMPTFTNFDSVSNPRSEDKCRPDRVLYRTPFSLRLDHALLFADTPIPALRFADGSDVFPSDHLGVYARFS